MDADRIKGAAQEAGGKIQQGFGKLTGDDSTRAEGAAREIGGKAQGAFGAAKDQIRETAEDVGAFANDAVQHGADYARQGADYAQQGVRAVENSMKDYPVAFLLAAAGFGFLAALLLRDHRRDSYYRR